MPSLIGTTALALAILLALLALGTVLGRGLASHRWGIPEALMAGAIGLLLAPSGAWPLIPPAVIGIWDRLPLILLTMVFGSLLLGKPLPRPGGLWRPLSAQVLLALILAFGQYVVAAVAVLELLQPWLGVSPVMACLIEVAYEGGHGSAAAMGPTYERLGLVGGQELGLAMATVGLLASTLVGGLVVVLARRLGWLTRFPEPGADCGGDCGGDPAPLTKASVPDGPAPGGPAAAAGPLASAPERNKSPGVSAVAPPGATRSGTVEAGGGPATRLGADPGVAGAARSQPSWRAALASWLINLGLAGIAVAIGWLGLSGLQALVHGRGGVLEAVIEALPVFPLALLGSLLVRLLLEASGRASLASAAIQGRIGTICADLLITAATACLDLSLLATNWRPLTVLALVGLVWNLLVVLLLAPRILPADWFERAILEFGQATGVAASGLLLLRLADPDDRSDALPAFSIKQLLLQPLLAGGVITVVAPLAVDGWGLPLWTGLCFALVLLSSGLGLWLGRQRA
ncbi:MAG: sodium:solute symporter [Cyanobacteriota bacterium]|nr:sodium:solute symporter [Cyanobacteriota bacterium]